MKATPQQWEGNYELGPCPACDVVFSAHVLVDLQPYVELRNLNDVTVTCTPKVVAMDVNHVCGDLTELPGRRPAGETHRCLCGHREAIHLLGRGDNLRPSGHCTAPICDCIGFIERDT